ncbi:MAG: hypothetical protein JSV03_03990 [Planctomycetota bacterium]|nr:MAG: hypothetical protein JSV03_03990 [Planctomycetota bacterium]
MKTAKSAWCLWMRRIVSVTAMVAVMSLAACDRSDPDANLATHDANTSKYAPTTPSDEAIRQTGPPTESASLPLDLQPLVGWWVRTDTPYVIEIRAARDNGTLEAAYYNPHPINVARAEARDKKSGLEVFVELRDVNYPGSTYTLIYDRATDMLQGIYFQAVAQQNFKVAFVRQQPKR